MTHVQAVARIREILMERIRLVPRSDYDETGATWMVKPGCLDKIAEEIAILMENRQPERLYDNGIAAIDAMPLTPTIVSRETK